ncbi:hypothetical protein MQX03_15565 [Chryseobacterium aahli]|uniref:hypothetical protein n=1 Tax=Chryseobacterium aahli TaxID=1278643 RepID=UPI001F609619|nr:hypothetical protein [Chryseobacterium aahli]MCI3938616.1 hypothetical protein [Chryseobacterium aahli]
MNNFLATIFCFIFSFSFSQKKKIQPPPGISYNNINKGFKPETFNNRIKNFPFNKTSKVKLISYNLDFKKEPIYTPPHPDDSIAIKNYYNRKIPAKLSDILYAENLNGIQQQKSLNLIEIQKLSNIIFNECDKYSSGLISSSGCYFPRNAVLFYDENDKIFAQFEICFQCDGFESQPKKLFEENMRCQSIYGMLESFFNKLGIKTQYTE